MYKILRVLTLILILAAITACVNNETKISAEINEFERVTEEIKTETEKGEKLSSEYEKSFKGRMLRTKLLTPENVLAKIAVIKEEAEWLRELKLFNKYQLSAVELIKSDIAIKKSLNKIKVNELNKIIRDLNELLMKTKNNNKILEERIAIMIKN